VRRELVNLKKVCQRVWRSGKEMERRLSQMTAGVLPGRSQPSASESSRSGRSLPRAGVRSALPEQGSEGCQLLPVSGSNLSLQVARSGYSHEWRRASGSTPSGRSCHRRRWPAAAALAAAAAAACSEGAAWLNDRQRGCCQVAASRQRRNRLGPAARCHGRGGGRQSGPGV
jgi:hypothetical protein